MVKVANRLEGKGSHLLPAPLALLPAPWPYCAPSDSLGQLALDHAHETPPEEGLLPRDLGSGILPRFKGLQETGGIHGVVGCMGGGTGQGTLRGCLPWCEACHDTWCCMATGQTLYCMATGQTPWYCMGGVHSSPSTACGSAYDGLPPRACTPRGPWPQR